MNKPTTITEKILKIIFVKKPDFRISIIAPFMLFALVACGSQNLDDDRKKTTQAKHILVTDFNNTTVPSYIKPFDAKTELVELSHNNNALNIKFSTKHSSSGITIIPDLPWSTSELGNNAFMVDVYNNGKYATMLSTNITGMTQKTQRRTVAIDAGETVTLYFELEGFELDHDTGLRDTPPSFITSARKMPIRGSKEIIDFSQVYAIKIYTETQINPTEVTIDNLRFEATGTPNKQYVTHIVDKFGQRADIDFDLKVSSTEELKRLADEERAQLKRSEGWPGRSQFGGWKEGEKFKATGFFRTQKVGDKWSLIDPEGYLYFSSGIANSRMSNTSTFTGIDYKDDSVRFIDPLDVTPEDSQGISGNYRNAQKTSYVANQQRHNMFEWFPSYDDELANHYGYRRKAHKGPMEHGEVYSFYQANLERRYGEKTEQSYLIDWHDITLDRMVDWGFTSFGNWTDPMFYDNTKMPYFANGWIIGEFKTLSSGFDIWGKMPDPFDPEFVRRAKITTEVIAKEVNDSPWCVGVFIDNEMSWGGAAPAIRRYGIVFDALSKSVDESPAKTVFVKMLKDKYKKISALNIAWDKNIKSWQELAQGVNYKKDASYNKTLTNDVSWLLQTYADEYFKVVRTAVKEVMPNHMYMGARFTTWGTAPEARDAAKKYADVVSYNYYREGIDEMTWGFLEALDAPVIIGEFHIGSTDVGHPNPGIIHAPNQKVRADMFKTYMNSAIDNPYIIGAHWFQYIDAPLTGRAHDGENYNVGFVTITDIPFPDLVDAAKDVHKNLYQRRYLNKPQ
ncbi:MULTISPECIES: beta-galactosidase [unclassified Psychrosphaera]|uniref:beta-galactosidase n=1 Tax=unclassified Psychrosphaera TaxID=2641570 RepID=UPI0020917E67|nr:MULTISPECIES: beta-galactosidase [unclassified Psychrosphaera]